MKRAGRVHAVRWGTRMLVALFLGIGIQQAMSHVWLRQSFRTATDGRGNDGP